MTGEHPSKDEAPRNAPEGAPVVVLVDPQLGENIGMVARAMLNFGLTELRLVRPRDGWPNQQAINTASGAHAVLESAALFDSTADAVADLNRIGATTARLRDMIKNVETPRQWAATVHQAAAADKRCGILFGPERVGLHNDDLSIADTLIHIPANPGFTSLNLAQSVLLTAYEWFLATGAEAPGVIRRKGFGAVPATQQDMLNFYAHLEGELDTCGFLRVGEKRPRMVRNIRNIFNRTELTDQEVRTLRGIVACLADQTKRPR